MAAGGLLLLVLGASPAAAHASLVSVDPPDGARLDQSPATVTLTFSETVSTGLGGVQVIDADGDQVQTGAARAQGAEVQVDVEPDLPEGTYVISYRVISADGHPVRGGSVFGVGDAEVDTGALGRVTAGGSDRVWEVIGAWGRGFAYAGTLVAAGGTAFLVLVHRGGEDRGTLRRLVRVAAVVGALGVLAALPVQAALGTGQGPGALFDEGVLGEVSSDGVGLGVGLAVLGLVVAVAFVDGLPWLALGGAALAAGSFATNGHTRDGFNVGLATTADVVHLLVAATWAGGLVLLLTALQHRRRAATDSADTVGLVGRFSLLATVTVLVVGLTGGTLAWTEVGTWNDLTSSTYGRLVLAKVAVVAVIVALGAYNHFRLVPALRAGGKTNAVLRRLRSTLAWEVLLLVAVVAVTSVLVVVTPARTLAEAGVVERDVDLGDAGRIQVTVDPAQVGQNTIHLYLFDPDGRPADIAEAVTLELSLPSADLGPITREATRAGPAHFQLDTGDLAVAGDWTLEVRARVDRFTEATGTTEVPVAR